VRLARDRGLQVVARGPIGKPGRRVAHRFHVFEVAVRVAGLAFAVERNSAATSFWPSTSAFAAKYR